MCTANVETLTHATCHLPHTAPQANWKPSETPIHPPRQGKLTDKKSEEENPNQNEACQGENIAHTIHRTIPLRKANISWRLAYRQGFALRLWCSSSCFCYCRDEGGVGYKLDASKSNILNIDAHRFRLETAKSSNPHNHIHFHTHCLFIIKTFAISYCYRNPLMVTLDNKI